MSRAVPIEEDWPFRRHRTMAQVMAEEATRSATSSTDPAAGRRASQDVKPGGVSNGKTWAEGGVRPVLSPSFPEAAS